MNQTIFDRRRAGLLVPVYALRHAADFGIGDTRSVREALDFCSGAGFSVLQLLPILETIGDPSPYSPVSSRALSPSLLSMDPEEVPGLSQEILEKEAPEAWLSSLRHGNVNHGVVRTLKLKLLTLAHARFSLLPENDPLVAEFHDFKSRESAWLAPYTLFRLLVTEYDNNTRWRDWRPEHRDSASAENWLSLHPESDRLQALRNAFAFIQWIAWRQWKDVRLHAENLGVRLIGDLTFGISADSCDTWAEPSLFEPEWSMGTRPLAHFDTSKDAERWGQNWGFPPYRWENHRSSGFAWLRGRVASLKAIFHGCRIDHLRGYFRAYMFPWQGGTRHIEFSSLDETEAAALTGGLLPRFVPGPDDNPITAAMNELQGRELIGVLIEEAGEMDLVAEIMGEMPGYMARTIRDLGLATLSFPQLLKTPSGRIIPRDEFPPLSLVTYANHDNAPLAWLYLHLKEASRLAPSSPEARDLQALLDFAGWTAAPPETLDAPLLAAFQDALFSTSGNLAMLLCSDLLGLPLRFNLPGSYGPDTWNDRLDRPLHEYATHPDYAPRIATAGKLIRLAERMPAGIGIAPAASHPP